MSNFAWYLCDCCAAHGSCSAALLDESSGKGRDEYDWANYPIGVVRMTEDAGHAEEHECDIVFCAHFQTVRGCPPQSPSKC